MKTSETTKPLYQRLNEERTPNEWIVKKEFDIYSSDNWHILNMNPYAPESSNSIANAEYTALAVNNLHHLAEALETLTKEIDLNKLNIKKDFSLINAHAVALKALNRIS